MRVIVPQIVLTTVTQAAKIIVLILVIKHAQIAVRAVVVMDVLMVVRALVKVAQVVVRGVHKDVLLDVLMLVRLPVLAVVMAAAVVETLVIPALPYVAYSVLAVAEVDAALNVPVDVVLNVLINVKVILKVVVNAAVVVLQPARMVVSQDVPLLVLNLAVLIAQEIIIYKKISPDIMSGHFFIILHQNQLEFLIEPFQPA